MNTYGIFDQSEGEKKCSEGVIRRFYWCESLEPCRDSG